MEASDPEEYVEWFLPKAAHRACSNLLEPLC